MWYKELKYFFFNSFNRISALRSLHISKFQIIVRLRKISNVRKNNEINETRIVNRGFDGMSQKAKYTYIELRFIYIPSTRSLCVKRVYMRDFYNNRINTLGTTLYNILAYNIDSNMYDICLYRVLIDRCVLLTKEEV